MSDDIRLGRFNDAQLQMRHLSALDIATDAATELRRRGYEYAWDAQLGHRAWIKKEKNLDRGTIPVAITSSASAI